MVFFYVSLSLHERLIANWNDSVKQGGILRLKTVDQLFG